MKIRRLIRNEMIILLSAFLVSCSGKAERQFKIVCGDNLALTPHMGRNSWYVWENHITDSIMRASADA